MKFVTLIFMTMLIIATLACATGSTDTPAVTTRTQEPTPTTELGFVTQGSGYKKIDYIATSDVIGHSRFRFTRPPTLNWQILYSDVVVIASFVSATAAVETLPRTPVVYRPMHILQFKAIEYLKGSGPSDFTVEVTDNGTNGMDVYGWTDKAIGYFDSKRALARAKELLAERNAAWDDQPAALFMNGPLTSVSGSASTGTSIFNFALNSSLNQHAFRYSVDTLSRDWLPASGSSGASSENEREFITNSSDSLTEVISITDLRTRISEIETLLNSGDGSDEYKKCVDIALTRDWHYSDDWESWAFEKTRIDSGVSKGAEFGSTRVDGYDSYDDFVYYFTSELPEMFETKLVDADEDPTNGYRYLHVITRPVPAGEYRLHLHSEVPENRPCNYRKSYTDGGYQVWTVTVTAPGGTLHEAFFDPVESGENEVSPASFSVGGDVYGDNGARLGGREGGIESGPHRFAGWIYVGLH